MQENMFVGTLGTGRLSTRSKSELTCRRLVMEQQLLTRKQLAEVLSISPNRVSELHGIGLFPRSPDGRSDGVVCTAKYKEYRSQFDSPASEDLIIAKASLVAERAKQKWIACLNFSGSLLPRSFVEKFHEWQRETVVRCVSEMVGRCADKVSGHTQAVQIGLVIIAQTDRALNAISDSLNEAEFAARYPEVCGPLIAEDCRTDFHGADPHDNLRDAQLEKVKWMLAYERLRTGLMIGDYIPESVFMQVVGSSIANVKGRIGGISTRLAAQLCHLDRDKAVNLIKDAADEALEEVKLYDREEYQVLTEGFVMLLNNATETEEEDK